MQKWIKNDSVVSDSDNGNLIAVIPEGVSEENINTIMFAPELKEAAEIFVQAIEARKNKTQSAYKQFKEILSKINKDETRRVAETAS